ncbi:hypothetical protein [Chitinimonas naiadis]
MLIVLITLLALPCIALLAIAAGILRFHGSISAQHLRGRYTWADEMAAQEAQQGSHEDR